MTRVVGRLFAALLLVVGLLCTSGPARSHELDSASLSLTEVAAGRFLVRWSTSSASLRELIDTPATFPAPCQLDGAYLECRPGGLVGTIEFPWLDGTLTRVMVDVSWQNGTRLLRVVDASAPRLKVYGIPESAGLAALAPIAVDYTELGIEHILLGFDHVFFVIALALLVQGRRRLVATVTAFTVAHSLTLGATVLGLVSLPSPPVEAAIALSIVLVCAECLRPAESLTRRAPWAVAFAFGLLHGLGFASVLLDIGLPEQRVPTALLFFNLGVEIGQLGIIAAVGGLRLLATRLQLRRAWVSRGVIYAMGSLAAFWSIERIQAVLGVGG